MFSPESEVNVQCEPMEENVLIYVIDKRKEMSLLQASLLLASLTLVWYINRFNHADSFS